MANKKELLKELHFYTDLLEKHEASKKEEMSKSSKTIQQSFLQRNVNNPSNLPYKFVKNPTKESLDKYSFKKPINPDVGNRRTVLSTNFKAKHELLQNQASKYASSANTYGLRRTVINEGASSVAISNRTVLCAKNKFAKPSVVLSDKSDKIHSHAKFMEEIASLKKMTELLKKRSGNKLSNSAKSGSTIQNKLSVHTSNEKFASSECNSLKSESVLPESKNLSSFPLKVPDSNCLSLNNQETRKNCYVKLNYGNKSKNFANTLPQKHFNHNKYSYKKVDAKPVSYKVNSIPLNSTENKDQTQNELKENVFGSHIRKTTYSGSKDIPGNPCLSSASALGFKYLSAGKQNLNVKFNMAKVSPSHMLCKQSNIVNVKPGSFFLAKVKSPIMLKSPKVSKLKSTGAAYVKINKHLTASSKSVHKITFSPRKTKRKVNTKYKVVNKILTPTSHKKFLNSPSSTNSKEKSPIAIVETESFFQNLNDSTIDKLEKDLMAISDTLTSAPKSSKTVVNSRKIPQHPRAKVNLSQHSKRLSLKKPKTRISKYKIVNSSVPRTVKKEQNFTNSKTSFKSVNYSKFRFVNKHLQPVHVLTPSKEGKSILVKRIYKSKNAIINKNTSSTSYRAKMIKSKYLTLNKRKSPSLKKHSLYPKVPSYHQKGYYLKSRRSGLHNKYQKMATSFYHPKVIKKFPNCGYSSLNRQFLKNASRNKYKRKLKSGYAHSPVVFIHGMRYSLNSSGKTLKKLPSKGQTTKTLRRVGGKTFIRFPENAAKISTPVTTNLASRVLHRSINRILSASSKKSLTKVNSYCMFYNRFGRCNRGVKCTYIHDPSKIAVCTRFLRGTCKNEGCPFSHEITPGKMAICSFFLVGACEKENCPYRHEKLLPDAQLCKAFVQGYCPHGKECKKAHILICPKYIQGDCDKGSSCAFPHPPRKVKKNVQTEEEENEEKKPDDVLLEKVSRYFLQTEDCLSPKRKSDEMNLVVPKKRRKLEEQPPFIPL